MKLVSYVCVAIAGMVFYQQLHITKLNLELNRYKELYEINLTLEKSRKDIYNDMKRQYLGMSSKYEHMREQNYILSRKFRRTDTIEYRRHLSKLMKEAYGTGGDADEKP